MNYKYRIVIFDEHPHDRGLLALALRSAEAQLEILEASTPLEIAHHVSSGAIDALIADPASSFGEVAGLAAELRKRSPQSLFWLFTGSSEIPTAAECVGLGVDGRTTKGSAGFLAMPTALLDRLRAQRELRAQFPWEGDSVFSGTFDLSACLLGKGGAIRAVNRAFEEMLERPRYELLELGFDQLLNEPGREDDWRRRFLVGHDAWEAAAPLRTASGRPLTAAFSANPLADAGAQQGLWAVCLMDVTRLLSAAPAVGPAVAAPGVDLDQILYAISHDLQAPLNSLSSQARTLGESEAVQGEEAREAAREIGTLAARMQLMLDGILQVADVRRGGDEPEVVGLDAILQDAMDNLRSEVEATAATIEREGLPTLRVNRQQMVQVLQNLLANALKFKGDRIPRIRVHAEESDETLRIVVEDNGIGIEARELERIFGMFQRLHTEREYPGIGVGLAISRQIVRAHGGDITVDSTPGRGSRFTIEFKGAALRSVNSTGNRVAG